MSTVGKTPTVEPAIYTIRAMLESGEINNTTTVQDLLQILNEKHQSFKQEIIEKLKKSYETQALVAFRSHPNAAAVRKELERLNQKNKMKRKELERLNQKNKMKRKEEEADAELTPFERLIVTNHKLDRCDNCHELVVDNNGEWIDSFGTPECPEYETNRYNPTFQFHVVKEK